jgi:4-hydroxybenzoate polyprenyltransferase
MRLPNVFSAGGDILLGFLFVAAALNPPLGFGLLVAASALLYLAGMILNDVFDVKQDTEERPGRPIPSGRIARGTAAAVGFAMLITGVGLAWTASALFDDLRPGIVASILAACIVFYDAWAKRTPLGPLAMGSCRMLNVLLGMSLAPHEWLPVHFVVAGGFGLYIVGVTWFARREAHWGSPGQLLGATLVMAAGIALIGSFTFFEPPEPLRAWRVPANWHLLLGLLGVISLRRAIYAIAQPEPSTVQAAVGQCLTSYLFFHAAVLLAVSGAFWAIVALSLLIPTLLLAMWIPRT